MKKKKKNEDTLNRLRKYLHRHTKVTSSEHEDTFMKMENF